jgi:hypothetical protein
MVRELVNSTKYWAAGHEEPEDTTAVCDTVAQ